MSVREQKGKLDGPTFFDRIVEGLPLHMPSEIPDLRDYVELALRGGFPSAIELDVPIRERWLESYVNQLITFDVANLRGVQDASRLRRYLQAYAANSAGFVSEQTLLEASDVDRKTASAYEQLLADLFVVESMPAWASSQLQRLVKGPKRYFVDSSVLGSVLGVDADSVMRNSDILGRLIDTFVVSQLRAEQEVTTCRPVFHHLREHQGRNEIDLIAEIRGQRVIACEIKASASPSVSDGRHLATLRDKLGDKFVKGIVFHTGPMVFELGEKILAVPIATLWA
jgi:predicted AAA+ superfamily ATPase